MDSWRSIAFMDSDDTRKHSAPTSSAANEAMLEQRAEPILSISHPGGAVDRPEARPQADEAEAA